MVFQTVWDIENIPFRDCDGFVTGLDFGTAFDYLPNMMAGGAVGLKMVCNEVFVALASSELKGIQELCVVHVKIHHQSVGYYPFFCSIHSCWLNCQVL